MSDGAAPAAAEPFAGRSLWSGLLVAWIAASAFSLILQWPSITGFEMSDPDDHLRLAQVRDWLGGQSWFDVSQQRFDPPDGAPMHWSRIVDLPLAATILLLTPLLGAAAAETAALTIVPLLLLGGTMASVALAVRPVAGKAAALLAAWLVPLIPPILGQLSPMRIDHHGWQIMTAGLLLASLVSERGTRAAVGAGLAAAVSVHISAEALPYAAAAGALLGLRYLASERGRGPLCAYLGTLAAASFLLFIATRASAEWLTVYCDALSPTFLIPFMAAAAIVAAGNRFTAGRSTAARAAVLGCAGAAAGASFLGLAADCGGGPFAALDPLVRRYWYLNVPEGLPIWAQHPAVVVGTVWTPLVGAIGTWLGWRAAADAEAAGRWAAVAFLLGAATALALLVNRSQGVAHLYALPGCGFLILFLLRSLARIRRPLARAPLAALAFLMPSPAPAMAAALELEETSGSNAGGLGSVACASREGFSRIAALPPQTLLAPIDIGPLILTSTPHSAVAGGYHRSNVEMLELIEAFIGEPDKARASMEARGIGLIVYCDDLAEVERYRASSPRGLVGRLERGELPDWLERVELGPSKQLRVFRMKPRRPTG